METNSCATEINLGLISVSQGKPQWFTILLLIVALWYWMILSYWWWKWWLSVRRNLDCSKMLLFVFGCCVLRTYVSVTSSKYHLCNTTSICYCLHSRRRRTRTPKVRIALSRPCPAGQTESSGQIETDIIRTDRHQTQFSGKSGQKRDKDRTRTVLSADVCFIEHGQIMTYGPEWSGLGCYVWDPTERWLLNNFDLFFRMLLVQSIKIKVQMI